MTDTNALTPYKQSLLKGYNAKGAGPAPTADALRIAHVFGRPGKQSFALAMAMRDAGMTAGQMSVACGAPQNNHRIALIKKGYFKAVTMPQTENGHTVYRIALTAKGQAKVDKALAAAAADAPVTGKAKAKRKAKAPATADAPAIAPADAPQADAPVTAEPVTG